MPAQYAPLPNPRSAPDAEREMADAFDLDDENEEHADNENTPLTINIPHTPSQHEAQSSSIHTYAQTPGGYDFEREYDFPPPGSPPRPSDRALPNDYGNSNGLLPSSPVTMPQPRQNLFRRVVGAILPSQYSRVPTENGPTGGGIENDGVFSNVVAKPQPAQVIRSEDGSVHIMPEETQKEAPPSYVEAQADAVPPYWETTVHAPAGFDPANPGEMIVEDLPTGSFLIFCINVFISFFFQFVGFLLTYLLHTSHAAKYGSRAGLGLTLIQYGFYSRTMSDEGDAGSGSGTDQNWPGGDSTPVPSDGTAPTPNDTISPTSRDWLSFLFMTLGWFLLLSSVIGFWRVKRWEHSIRNPPAPPTPEQLEREQRVRQTLEDVFGIPFSTEESHNHSAVHQGTSVQHTAAANTEERLTRNLRAAGLI